MPKQPSGDAAMNRSIGFVTKVRVNPSDIMGCIDLVNAANARVDGMSLSMVVRRALSIAIETMRVNKAIPRRDGFEYHKLVQPFLPQREKIGRAVRIAAGHSMVIADVQAMIADRPIAPSIRMPTMDPDTMEQELKVKTIEENPSIWPRRFRMRIKEALELKRIDPDNWDEDRERELRMMLRGEDPHEAGEG